jgi:hypothetical protein
MTMPGLSAVTRFGAYCVLALLCASVSPAFAATLSRSADVSATLSAAWSMIGTLCAVEDWLPRFGTRAREPTPQIISL